MQKTYHEKSKQRYGIILLCLFTIPMTAFAQTNANYIKTVRMLDSLQSHTVISYQFYDGLGRQVLSATNGMGMSGNYAYTLQTYDAAGNVSRQWLPVVGSSSIQLMAESSVSPLSSSQYGDSYGYNSFAYDALGRLTESTIPGDVWHTGSKKKTIANIINNSGDHTSHPAGSLIGELTADEDGHTFTTFYNLLGQKVQENRGTEIYTRYIYNDFGLLASVRMPGYNSADPNHTSFGYEYDERGRITRKRFPGADYIQYWYDSADRVAFMQDGMLRQKGRYRFMLYDVFGRLAVQGTCSGGGISEVSSAVPTATFIQNSSGFLSTGYVISNGVSITAPSLEIVNYYDGYEFLSGSMSDMFSPIATQNGTCVKGLPTGCITATSNGGFVCTINLYDDKGRVVETRSTTPDATLTEVQTTAYTFTDNPRTSDYRLLRSGQGTAFVAHAANTYYAANDKLHAISLQVGINSSQPTSSRTVQDISYNDLGQVSSIARPGSAGSVSYEYDLHGWITNITTPSFREELYYATDGDCSGTPCYNGNISVQKWSNGNYVEKRGYKFAYDALNRLTEGIYGERDALSYHKNYFNEQILEYYKGGAAKRLQRRGMKNDGEHGKVDNLHITVKGNRLHYVSDDAEKLLYDGAFDFHGDGSNSSAYHYNANGSLITDTGKGIMFIAYDDNGMPRRIQFADGNVTEYVYTATGRKLRTIYYTAMPGITVGSGETHQLSAAEILSKDSIDYFGNLIMENGVPAQYLFPGGYCSLRDGSGNAAVAWHYYNQDHLGNNREVVSESGTLEQVTNYYPFGAPFCEPTVAGVNTNATLQRYKYNGKELDLMHGLKWYDYGARMYDPILLTWNGIDPLCENYYNISPYAYCANNPVSRIDPNGLDWYQDEFGHLQWNSDLNADNWQDILSEESKYIGTTAYSFEHDSGIAFFGNENGVLSPYRPFGDEGVVVTGTDLSNTLKAQLLGNSGSVSSGIYAQPDFDAMGFEGGFNVHLGSFDYSYGLGIIVRDNQRLIYGVIYSGAEISKPTFSIGLFGNITGYVNDDNYSDMNNYMGQSFNYGINMGPFNVGYNVPSVGEPDLRTYQSYNIGINIGYKTPGGFFGVYNNSSLSKPIISF